MIEIYKSKNDNLQKYLIFQIEDDDCAGITFGNTYEFILPSFLTGINNSVALYELEVLSHVLKYYELIEEFETLEELEETYSEYFI